MNSHDPSNDFRRRQKIPYNWQIERQRRRRILGRVVIGLIGLSAIGAIILLLNHR